MSKFCVKCGIKLEDATVFCDVCGARQMVHNVEKQEKKILNTESNSKLGIASFIFGIISLISCGSLIIPEILGIVFAVIDLRDKTRKHGLTKAGLIMSIIACLMIGVGAIRWFSIDPEIRYEEIYKNIEKEISEGEYISNNIATAIGGENDNIIVPF